MTQGLVFDEDIYDLVVDIDLTVKEILLLANVVADIAGSGMVHFDEMTMFSDLYEKLFQKLEPFGTIVDVENEDSIPATSD